MTPGRRIALFLLIACGTIAAAPVRGQTALSAAFYSERDAAEKAAQETQSVEPLLKLFDKFTKPEEIAELELTLGLVYTQRTGLVNPAEGVVHLTNALKYAWPEDVRVQALVWRADDLSRLGRVEDSLKDRFRVLVAVLYRDLSGGCPPIENVPLPIANRRGDPENDQRQRDYQDYRAQQATQTHFLLHRYSSIEGIRNLQKQRGLSDAAVLKALTEVSPDKSRHDIILRWLKEPNPWPCK